MSSARWARARDLAPLLVGIALFVVPLVVMFTRWGLTWSTEGRFVTLEQIREEVRVETFLTMWLGYGLPTIGLVIIAYWIGRRSGRRRQRATTNAAPSPSSTPTP